MKLIKFYLQFTKSLLFLFGQGLSISLTKEYDIPLTYAPDTICVSPDIYAVLALKDSDCIAYHLKENNKTFFLPHTVNKGSSSKATTCTIRYHIGLATGPKVTSFDWLPYTVSSGGELLGGTGASFPFLLPEGAGINYGPSDTVANTTYFIVAMDSSPNSVFQAFRIPVIQLLGSNVPFSLLEKPTDLAFKNGTFHFVVGYIGSKREIFDVTNPFLTSRHEKLHGDLLEESSISTGSKSVDYYVAALTGILEVVRFTQATIKKEIQLGNELSPNLKKIEIVPNSDIVFLLDVSGYKIGMVRFLDQNPSITIEEVSNNGEFISDIGVENLKGLLVLSDTALKKISIFKIEEYPCLNG